MVYMTSREKQEKADRFTDLAEEFQSMMRQFEGFGQPDLAKRCREAALCALGHASALLVPLFLQLMQEHPVDARLRLSFERKTA